MMPKRVTSVEFPALYESQTPQNQTFEMFSLAPTKVSDQALRDLVIMAFDDEENISNVWLQEEERSQSNNLTVLR